jgi:DNA-binding response OmpR family regulator
MKKVLIIDDEKNIRMTLNRCLINNYDVELSVNGEDGLEKAKANDFDLIFLDIKMPGMNGIEVLHHLRQADVKSNVVIMTAYGTVENAVEAMKLGAVDFIAKPFSPEEIRSIARDVLSREEIDEESLADSKKLIEFSKKCIVEGDFKKAKKYLKEALAQDTESPEPHNLLGVIFEYNNDVLTAQKHYRAALALDSSYKPADRNLERTVMNDKKKKIVLDESDLDDKE